ncbi:hypothetical protein [Streptomyces sp. NBC_01361]|uniref:hypothetical protein n=1 Tax=Streptomyces sp. NBC_01361 TaxID=2903838 RepID=UPI002E2F6C22|nr:hypothetical protein [Streptomyces sp. NBC_01361]
MPTYPARRDADRHLPELEASDVSQTTQLSWPTSSAAAAAELAELAHDLTNAGVTVEQHPDALVLPHLAAGPGDTAGIRVRVTGRHPHALYVITATALVPLAHAAGALAYLQPLIEAAARECDGCGAEPGEPCRPMCLDPSAV